MKDINIPGVYEQIIADLKRLVSSGVSIFGSNRHGFRLNSPVPEDELQAFEHEHGVQLPEDYRLFLAHVGRGGAGPHYGLFNFHQMDDGFDYRIWSQDDGFVGILANSFPFTNRWNDLTGQPDDELSEQDEQEYEKQLASFEKRYWTQLNGAIPICHLGCALRQWLVISGPETGNVWCDNRADYNGLAPLTRQGSERISFFTWYRDWLDIALKGK